MNEERRAWLADRKLGIGSSDAPAIHNKSPYLTAIELYNEKISPVCEEESNFAMQKGNEYEPKARALFEAYWETKYKGKASFSPKNVVMPTIPFIKASLDGYSEEHNTFIEIKYVGEEIYDSGVIPEHYMIQMQHQYLASNARDAYFVCTRNGLTIKTIRVKRDEAFLKDHVGKCAEFWHRVTNRTPPPLSDRDFKELEGHDSLIANYVMAKSQVETATKLLEEIKEKLISVVDHPKMCRGDFKIQKINSRGSISYKELLKLDALQRAIKRNKIDPERFRSQGKTYYKITIGNEEP